MVNFVLFPEKLKTQVCSFYLDTLIEKHEGGSWQSWVEYRPQLYMLEVLDGFLLLQLYEENFPNITILNAFKSPDEKEIFVRLEDTTYGDDGFDIGYIALGSLLEGTNIYVCTFYHNYYDFERIKNRKNV